MNIITIEQGRNELEFLATASVASIVKDTTEKFIGVAEEIDAVAQTYKDHALKGHVLERASLMAEAGRDEDAYKYLNEVTPLLSNAGQKAIASQVKVYLPSKPIEAVVNDSEEVAKLKAELENTKALVTAKTQEVSRVRNELEADIQAKQNQIKRLSESPELEKLSKQVAELEAENKDAQSAKAKLSVYEEQMAKLQEEIGNKLSAIASKDREVIEAKQEMNQVKSKYDTARAEFVLSQREQEENEGAKLAKAISEIRKQFTFGKYLAEHDMTIEQGERAKDALEVNKYLDPKVKDIAEIIYNGGNSDDIIRDISALVRPALESLRYASDAKRYAELERQYNNHVSTLAKNSL